MDNSELAYALVSDDCPQCIYVSNVFTLLRLKLTKLSFENCHEAISKADFRQPLILCPGFKNKVPELLKKIRARELPLIIFTEQEAPPKNLIGYQLPLHFTQFELKKTLAKIQACFLFQNEKINDPIFEKLLGPSKAISHIKQLIVQVAESDATVLLLGESGTGKDVVASCIHHLSKRHKHPFVPINCGAIPFELIESELFGHEKGAFTGAATRRQGRFEIAKQGSLFLDEIGDMPLPMQVKLLRVLQEKKFQRVGGNEYIPADVRIIAATNKNLLQLVEQHQFRSDLFYRINVFPIDMPNLAERSEDIPYLIDYHVEKIYERINHKVFFTEDAKQALCAYPWPGNIRELENFLERMVILNRDKVLDLSDLDEQYRNPKKPNAATIELEMSEEKFDFQKYLAEAERLAIQFALKRSNGILTLAAQYLSISSQLLAEKIAHYQLSV